MRGSVVRRKSGSSVYSTRGSSRRLRPLAVFGVVIEGRGGQLLPAGKSDDEEHKESPEREEWHSRRN
jgi:hypothetical protein